MRQTMKKLSDNLKSSKGSFFTGLQILALLIVLLVPLGCSRRQAELTQKERIMQAVDLYERGKVQEQEEDLARAANLYQQSLAISPRPVVHYRLGLVQTRLGEYEQALENLEQAQVLAPGMSRLVKSKKDQVQSLIRMSSENVSLLEPLGQRQAVPEVLPEIEFQDLPEDSPESGRALIRSDEEMEKSDESIETAEKVARETESTEKPEAEPSPQEVVAVRPRPTDTARQPEEVAVATPEPTSTPVGGEGDLPEKGELEKIREEPSPQGQGYSREVNEILSLAYEAADRGDNETAIKHFEEAHLRQPNDPKILYNLGYLNQEQERFVRAYLKYKSAVESDPNFGQAWNNLGFVLERLSRSELALDCYETAISTGNRDAYFNAGYLLEKKGRLEEALQRFRQYLEKGTDPEVRKKAQEHVRRLEMNF
jgi:tetratricopeptide (TPR) repeat protein